MILFLFPLYAHSATPGPTISILDPAEGKTVWSTGTAASPVRIVFEAYDADGVNSSSFKLSVDSGAFSLITVGNYGLAGLYFYDWTPTAGTHAIQIQGQDTGSNTGNSRKVNVNVRVEALKNYSTFPGDGTLLIRDNDNTLCMSCHALKSHSSKNISTKYGNWERVCRDCHTPHNTRNIFLLQSSFRIYTGTNQSYAYNKKVDFRNISGESIYGFVTKSGSVRRGPCEVCHTRTQNVDNTPRWRNWTSRPDTDGSKHNGDAACPDCHLHTDGFSPGESPGNKKCSGCHKSLLVAMNTGDNMYHHYMDSANVTVQSDSGSKYTVTTSILGTFSGNAKRRCLMCHADHDVFRPDLNANSIGRAGNLRKSVMFAPTLASGFARSEFFNQTSSSGNIWGGLCLSCHRKSQRKYTSMLANDGSIQTPIIPFPGGAPSDYAATAHGNYTVPSSFKSDGSRFNANCLKCHNDALTKTKQAGSGDNAFGTHTTSYGLHGSPVRRLQALMGHQYYMGVSAAFDTSTSIVDSGNPGWTSNQWSGSPVAIVAGKGRGQGRSILFNSSNRIRVDSPWNPTPDATSKYNIEDPIEEDLCYRCHSTSKVFNPYSTRGVDYYGVKKFESDRAQKMYEMFNNGWPQAGYIGTVASPSGRTGFSVVTSGNDYKLNRWTASQFNGANGTLYQMLMKSGRAKGKTSIITANTANSITYNDLVRVPYPAAGDKFIIQSKPYRHRVESYTGKHRTDEYFIAQSDRTNTPFGWFSSVGGQHTGCTDCHNPHSARPQGITSGRATDDSFTTTSSITDSGLLYGSKSWTPGQWRGYMFKVYDTYTSLLGVNRVILDNTGNRLSLGGQMSRAPKGAYYVVESSGKPPKTLTGDDHEGNEINNANVGVWGVQVNYTTKPLPGQPQMNPNFIKTAAATKVYEICFKCHSDYGWGVGRKRIEIPDKPAKVSGTFKFVNGTSSNVAREFNPNNLSHHAIIAPGNNQPIKPNYGNTGVSSSYNFNASAVAVWPYYGTSNSGDTVAIDSSGNATLSGAANLPSTVIAGWYLWVDSAGTNGGDKPHNGARGPVVGKTDAGWFQVAQITDSQHFKVGTLGVTVPVVATQYWAVSAGLGNNFVPPYGPWSVLNCADCHGSDRRDPAGPHASSYQWIRRDLDRSISFDWFDGTRVSNISYRADTLSGSTKYLCLNCHRADVYGYEGTAGSSSGSGGSGAIVVSSSSGVYPTASYARVSHPVDETAALLNQLGQVKIGSSNAYGIACMTCHGGSGGTLGPNDTLGGIHGSNLGKDPLGSGGSPGSFQGRRMLNGASWGRVTRASTTVGVKCWTKPYNANDSVTTCSAEGNGPTGGLANYDYDSTAD